MLSTDKTLQLNTLLAAFQDSVPEGLDVIVDIPIKGKPSMRSRKVKETFLRSLVIRAHRERKKKPVSIKT